MRHYHQIPQPNLLKDGELTVTEVARRLWIGHASVIHWIARGWLSAGVVDKIFAYDDSVRRLVKRFEDSRLLRAGYEAGPIGYDPCHLLGSIGAN
jgi:hypothetical protein